MLQFLRTYQKIFFIIITVVIAVSFVFFGTFTSLPNAEHKKDRLIAKAIDGSAIMSRDVEMLSNFLSSSALDVFEQPANRNLLNDGVIEKDFLVSGLGAKLAEHYFSSIQDEIGEVLQKAKNYRSYVHPHAPFLHAEVIWENYNPDLMEHLRDLRTTEGEGKVFSLLSSLYIDQIHFPPDLLKRVVQYQQNQYSWFPQDTDLNNRNLNLFGFKSMQDWFGAKWIEVVSQFVLNAAAEATQRGYVVSKEEAEASLLKNIHDSVRAMDAKSTFTYSDAYQYLQNRARMMGMEVKDAVKVWQNVLLFRHLFTDIGGSVFVDHFTYQNFADFAKQQAEIDLYLLPKEFYFSDLRTMLKAQVYFDAIKKNTQHPLDFPKEILTVAEVAKKYPQLVYKSYSIEFSKAQKKQFHNRISLKDLWSWQVKDEGWNAIVSQFPELSIKEVNESERFAFLEKQEKGLHDKIDRFSLNKMVTNEWIKDQLLQAEKTKMTLMFHGEEGRAPLSGITSLEDLTDLLDLIPIDGKEAKTDEERLAVEKLQFYSQDGETFYQIQLLETPKDKQIVTFSQALASDTLDQILDDKLLEQYQVFAKKNNPIVLKSDGSKKTFAEAKEEISLVVYSSLLDAIKEEFRKVSDEDISNVSSSFYPKYRFLRYLSQVKNDIQFNSSSDFIGNAVLSTLQDQWKLVKEQKTIERSLVNRWMGDDLFDMPAQSWSETQLVDESLLGFFYINKKGLSKEASFEKWEEEKVLLSQEAKKNFLMKLVHKINEKNAIVLSQGE